MGKRVIFLDVDGVLNTIKSTSRIHGIIGIDDDKVKKLSMIRDKTDSIVVLTSSWKIDWEKTVYTEDLNSFGRYLVDKLKKYNIYIFDKTDEESSSKRGSGIREWIKSCDFEIDSFVILDDELFDYDECGLMPHVVKTSFYDDNGGLQEEHINRSIAILLNNY